MMRFKKLGCLLVLGLMLVIRAPIPGFSQGKSCDISGACKGNVTTNGDAVILPVPQDTATIVVTVAGTSWTGTLQFQQSSDGASTWHSSSGSPQPSGAAVTSTTANGQWRFVGSGLTNFQVIASATISGTANVTITPSKGSAASGGSGCFSGGDLTGCSPNPTVANANGVPLPTLAGQSGYLLDTNGTLSLSAGIAVAHNLLSATHSDTTPAAVERGAVITGQGVNPTWAKLIAGVQYQSFVMGVSDPGWGAMDLGQAASHTGILDSSSGGTGNGFFAVTGPLTSTKTFTFPNNNATVHADYTKDTFAASTTAAASLNIPSGVAPTTGLATGDLWNLSGVLQHYDGTHTNSLARIQAAVVGGNYAEFSGTDGLLVNSGYAVGNAVNFNGAGVSINIPVLATNGSGQLVASTGHQVSVPLACVAGGGSGTAYTCTTAPTFAPVAGDEILFKADVANTAAATLVVNAQVGTPAIKKQGGGTALVANDLLASQYVVLLFDGTNWQMQGQIGNAPATGNLTATTPTANGVMYGQGTQALGVTGAGAADYIFMGNDAGAGAAPAFKAGPSGGTNGCAGSTDTPTYNTSTHLWGCHQISGFTPSGTQYGLVDYATSSSFGTVVTVPTTKGLFVAGYNLPTDAAAAPSVMQVGYASRGVTGTTATDTVLFSDNAVEYQGSVAVAVTLPTAATLENTSFAVQLDNHTTGTATAVTVTPTTWTINGASTLVIAQGQSCFVSVDPAGSAWDANCHEPQLTAGIGITLTRSAYGLVPSLSNPTASTLGGIKSLAAVTSNWIDSISTSGVPHASRPALSDLTATVTSPIVQNSNNLSCPTCLAGPDKTIMGGIIGTTWLGQTGAASRYITWFTAGQTGNQQFVSPLTMWLSNFQAFIQANSNFTNYSSTTTGLALTTSNTPYLPYWTIPGSAAVDTVVTSASQAMPPVLVPQGMTFSIPATNVGGPVIAGYTATMLGSTAQILGTNLNAATVSTGATVYAGPSQSATPSSDETTMEVPVPWTLGGTAKNLCWFQTTSNGAGGALTVHLRQGVAAAGAMADSTVTQNSPLSYGLNNAFCDYYATTGHSVTIAQADRIDFGLVNGNGSAASGAVEGFSLEVDPNGTANGWIVFGLSGVTLPNATTKYISPFGIFTNADKYQTTAPMSGARVAVNLIGYCTAAPGTMPATFTLFQNGSATNIVATIPTAFSAPGEVSDLYASTGHSVNYADGDNFTLRYYQASTGTAPTCSAFSLETASAAE